MWREKKQDLSSNHLFALFSLILFMSVFLPAQVTATALSWCHSGPVACLLIECVSVCIQMSSLFPISVNLDCTTSLRMHALTRSSTHTHTLENLRQCTMMHLATGCSHQQKGNGCILRSGALTTASRCFTAWWAAAAMHAQHWLEPPVW